jgi:type IV pilus assembly protein PilM
MIQFHRSQVQPIGVDLGADSVRMLQVEVVGRGLAVRAAARRELPEEARQSPELRLPVAVDLVRQMLRHNGFVGRSIVTAMPREIVHVKNLRMPKIPPAEIDAAVQFEAANLFPFDTCATFRRARCGRGMTRNRS